MIDERARHALRPIMTSACHLCAMHKAYGKDSMIGGVTGFLIAVSAVSAGIFVLMTRAENRRIGGARASSTSAYDGGGVGGDSGWGLPKRGRFYRWRPQLGLQQLRRR